MDSSRSCMEATPSALPHGAEGQPERMTPGEQLADALSRMESNASGHMHFERVSEAVHAIRDIARRSALL